MSLIIDKLMLDQGYFVYRGLAAQERRDFEVIEHYPDDTYLVRDPYEDMLQHWAITPDEVEIEEAQGDTTPIPWMRTFNG